MHQKTTKTANRSRRKSVESRGKVDRIDHEERSVQLTLPIAEILAGVSDAVERVAGDAGLLVIKALIDEEVEKLAGKRYEHQEDREAHRWGSQESHVVFAGKKTPFKRPRVRSTDGKELRLERAELFQTDGRMQQAAARQVALGVSMRDYEKAVDGVCDGYGIRKSSVSRHWKAISTKKLEELMERPVMPRNSIRPSSMLEFGDRGMESVSLGSERSDRRVRSGTDRVQRMDPQAANTAATGTSGDLLNTVSKTDRQAATRYL